MGITGGIAAYKSAILARLFVKAGADVQVIMTPNAREFISPLTLSTLTGKPVISKFFTANTGQWNSHVDLGLWADAFVVAPATASSIAKMAAGVADNMLITSYLSTRAQVFIAPAMDFDMMKHPTTVHNLSLLRSYGNIIIEPAEGELASHLVGKGRMEEPENIFNQIKSFFEADQPLKGKKILVTAGPTYEKIDPVRFIGNFSSGLMGFSIANVAAKRGAEVTLVAGPVGSLELDSRVHRIDVVTAREMFDAATEAFPGSDIAVLSAAVADYRPAETSPVKIKREGSEPPEIKLVKNPDIAAALGKTKTEGQLLIGFALETDHAIEHAADKISRKKLDMIVVNSLEDDGAGFGVATNKVTTLTSDGKATEFPLKSKTEVAEDILDMIQKKI